MGIINVPVEHADAYRRAGWTDLSSLLPTGLGMSQPMPTQPPAPPASGGSRLTVWLVFLLFLVGVGAAVWLLFRQALTGPSPASVAAATSAAAPVTPGAAPTATLTVGRPTALPETMLLCCDGACRDYATRREVYALAERMGGWEATQRRCNIVGLWWTWQDQLDWYAAHP